MSLRFLVIDDHPVMRFGVRGLIAQCWPDAEVVEAATLAEAIVHASASAWTAITMDLLLPDVVGLEELL